MQLKQILVLAVELFFGVAATAQQPSSPSSSFPTPLHYICYYTPDSIRIDGNGSEPAWQKVPWTEDFVDIEGAIRPKPTWRTRARMLWDSVNLYLLGEIEEPDLQGFLHQHDTIIFQDNDFEVFVNPDNSTHNYFELEFNSLGTLMDLFMWKPYREGGKALMSWDAQGIRSAVMRKGTVNHPGDKDEGWTVEMAIPLATLRFFGDRPPRDNSIWRINFSRVEWDWDVKDGGYVKRTNPATGRQLPEHNWVWSPQGIVDMHAPERWGYLQFSSHDAGEKTVPFLLPPMEEARDILWRLYYAQRDYHKKHRSYASGINELSLPVTNGGITCLLTLEGISSQYKATVTGKAFTGKLTIDQDGKVEWIH